MKTLLVILFLASCAFAQDPAAVAVAEAACGPESTRFEVNTDQAQAPDSPTRHRQGVGLCG